MAQASRALLRSLRSSETDSGLAQRISLAMMTGVTIGRSSFSSTSSSSFGNAMQPSVSSGGRRSPPSVTP